MGAVCWVPVDNDNDMETNSRARRKKAPVYLKESKLSESGYEVIN